MSRHGEQKKTFLRRLEEGVLPLLKIHEYKCDPEDLKVGSLGCIYQLEHLQKKEKQKTKQ